MIYERYPEKQMSIVNKWGNSLALRLPKDVVEKAKLTEGMRVTIEVQDGKIVVIPKKKYTLDELLANTNPSDYGGEIDWGNPVGNEEW